MHIGRHIVQELVMQFGEPVVERWEVPLGEDELDEVRRHRERGRSHDVSMLIVSGGSLAVIRKPGYPDGAFRIPSGGIHPEESFLDGAAREAHEETGLVVTFTDYLLQVHAEFTSKNGEDRLPWVTHVLQGGPGPQAEDRAATLSPKDGAEIEAAKWVDWQELLSTVNGALKGSGRGGLDYRARLHQRLDQIVNGDRSAND